MKELQVERPPSRSPQVLSYHLSILLIMRSYSNLLIPPFSLSHHSLSGKCLLVFNLKRKTNGNLKHILCTNSIIALVKLV